MRNFGAAVVFVIAYVVVFMALFVLILVLYLLIGGAPTGIWFYVTGVLLGVITGCAGPYCAKKVIDVLFKAYSGKIVAFVFIAVLCAVNASGLVFFHDFTSGYLIGLLRDIIACGVAWHLLWQRTAISN